ncbi:hypothetical protein ACFLT2_11215 [Acidobacteriota bacterium]
MEKTETIFHRWGKIDVLSGRTNLIIRQPYHHDFGNASKETLSYRVDDVS